MELYIGSDHAGYDLKEFLKLTLPDITWQDEGTFSIDSVDYPDYAKKVAEAVSESTDKRGILVCGSGNGVAITANKFPKIRAAIAWNEEISKLARAHNDANILCLPARFITENEAIKIVNAFLNTPFDGGRHQTRVNKISA